LQIRKLRSSAAKLAQKAPQLLNQVHTPSSPSLLSSISFESPPSSSLTSLRLSFEGSVPDANLSEMPSATSPSPKSVLAEKSLSPRKKIQNFELTPSQSRSENSQVHERPSAVVCAGGTTPNLGATVVDDFDRLKMIALYEAHNPTKVGEVDRLLVKYEGKHAAMFAKLGQKYGVKAMAASERVARESKKKITVDSVATKMPPVVPNTKIETTVELVPKRPPFFSHHADTTPNLSASVVDDFDRLKMIALYEANNPTKVDEVNGLLAKYEGKHAAMFAKLEQKYGAAAMAVAERAVLSASQTSKRKAKPPPLKIQLVNEPQSPLPLSPFSATFSKNTNFSEGKLQRIPSYNRMKSLPISDEVTGLTVSWVVFAKAGPEGDEMKLETIRGAEDNKREDEKEISTKLHALWLLDASSMVELKKITKYHADDVLALNRMFMKMQNEAFKEAREASIAEEKALEVAAEEAYANYLGSSVENAAAAEKHRVKRQKQLEQQKKRTSAEA
jgi:hypothetical protein